MRRTIVVGTSKQFEGEKLPRREPESCLSILERHAIYGRPERVKAERATKAAAPMVIGAPITNEEALELIRKHRELEARLIAEERAEEQAEAKAKRLEFVRARQSALAALNKAG